MSDLKATVMSVVPQQHGATVDALIAQGKLINWANVLANIAKVLPQLLPLILPLFLSGKTATTINWPQVLALIQQILAVLANLFPPTPVPGVEHTG